MFDWKGLWTEIALLVGAVVLAIVIFGAAVVAVLLYVTATG